MKTEDNRVDEYVYYFHERYQNISEVARGLYRKQGSRSRDRKVTSEDTLSWANIINRHDITVSQLVVLRQ